jgi:NADH-quinone oxidoreductase subunit C
MKIRIRKRIKRKIRIRIEMMTGTEITAAILERFAGSVTGVFPEDKHPRVHMPVEHWRSLAEFLRHDSALSFDWLSNLTSLDYVADGLACVAYDFWSFDRRHSFAVKVFSPRSSPVFPSVVDLWPAANWHEREAFDLMGFEFPGHPDLRRILMADDWYGHPLRKDYTFPREYHGIPASVELDWAQE